MLQNGNEPSSSELTKLTLYLLDSNKVLPLQGAYYLFPSGQRIKEEIHVFFIPLGRTRVRYMCMYIIEIQITHNDFTQCLICSHNV